MMQHHHIHLSVPHMGGDEQRLVAEAFADNWLSTVGPNLDAFEREVAARLGQESRTLAVASGTAAIHLLLRVAGVGTGDTVAVQSLTFAGGVFPVLYQGARPVFIDSEPVSGGIDPALTQEWLRQRARAGRLPKALIIAHLFGQHADILPVARACEELGVTLIEDAAESLGSTYRGRETATNAPLAALSFNGNKIITTTGGGMCVARHEAAIARMRKWATQAREPVIEYKHAEVGHNYRMSNVLAGIGRGQLRVLDERIRQRRAVFGGYQRALADIPGLRFQPEAPWGKHTRWLTVLYIDRAELGVVPHDVVRALAAEHIDARPIWRPMHTQPLFKGAEVVGGEVAERLYAEGLCLPSSSSLGEGDQQRVIEALRRVLL